MILLRRFPKSPVIKASNILIFKIFFNFWLRFSKFLMNSEILERLIFRFGEKNATISWGKSNKFLRGATMVKVISRTNVCNEIMFLLITQHYVFPVRFPSQHHPGSSFEFLTFVRIRWCWRVKLFRFSGPRKINKPCA